MALYICSQLLYFFITRNYWIIHLVQAAQYLLFRGPYGKQRNQKLYLQHTCNKWYFFCSGLLGLGHRTIPCRCKALHCYGVLDVSHETGYKVAFSVFNCYKAFPTSFVR